MDRAQWRPRPAIRAIRRASIALLLVAVASFGGAVPVARADPASTTQGAARPQPTPQRPSPTPQRPQPAPTAPPTSATTGQPPRAALASGSVEAAAAGVPAGSVQPAAPPSAPSLPSPNRQGSAPAATESASVRAPTAAVSAVAAPLPTPVVSPPLAPPAGAGPPGSAVPAGSVRPAVGTPVQPTPTADVSAPTQPVAAAPRSVDAAPAAPAPAPATLPPTARAAPDAASATARNSAAPIADILAGWGAHWSPGDGSQAQALGALARSAGGRGELAGEPRPAAAPAITTAAALRRASASEIGAWTDDAVVWLRVPFRTQIDGTPYAPVNCGPASLAMVLAAFGIDVAPAPLRDYVNQLSGNFSVDDGTSLHVLARVAADAGLNAYGVGDRWSIDRVRDHLRAGHPVITLVKYRSLPGNARSAAEFDHYIVLSGMAGDDVIYNDAAFVGDYGHNLLISPGDLERAWGFSSVPRHAVAIGLAGGPVQVGFAPRLRGRLAAPAAEPGRAADGEGDAERPGPAAAGEGGAPEPDDADQAGAPDALMADRPTDGEQPAVDADHPIGEPRGADGPRPIALAASEPAGAGAGPRPADTTPPNAAGASPRARIADVALDRDGPALARASAGRSEGTAAPPPATRERASSVGAILALLLVHGALSGRAAAAHRRAGVARSP